MIRVARTQLTRNEIIRLAANSFAQDGYTQTSIHGLCKRLNMSTGNLTFYFPTREHLLAELVDMLCEFQRKQFEKAQMLASGIEYGTLMPTSGSAPLELRISGALNTILTIYQVPEEIRKQKIQKVLEMDYREIGLRVLKDFRAYVDHKTEQALYDLLGKK